MRAEKYCPVCRNTHLFESYTSASNYLCWQGTAGYCKARFSEIELNHAFTNLSKDPEYKEKGVSLPMASIPNPRAFFSEKDVEEAQIKEKANTFFQESNVNSNKLTLPIDSQERKGYPLLSGCLKYFGAALASVARTSKLGNDKHNPNQPLHHARGKSMDHGDCIVRHLVDIEDMIAANTRSNALGVDKAFTDRQILDEAGSLAWRALAYSQELHEKLGAAPLAAGAKE